MSKVQYTEEELNRYFSDPRSRRADGNGRRNRRPGDGRPKNGVRGYFHRKFDDPAKAQAAFVLSLIAGSGLLAVLVVAVWSLFLIDDLPTFQQLDNPSLQLATVAYTADNKELARYAFQNRSWVTYDEISPHAVNALVATEDRRFYDHWGIDLPGILVAASEAITKLDVRGASTISQQLARNLYNQDIGFDVTPTRKMKEMITAVHLERRYTKREIIEMYLNTVSFSENAFGIEAAAQTFFSKPATDLGPLEAASLVGMLQATTYYNPHRNPNNNQRRRNVVLNQMVKAGYLSAEFYDDHSADPVEVVYNPSAEITASLAPYFAEQVRLWMREWSRENGYSLYSDGMRVYTTLDSRMQELAVTSVRENMDALQKVVDYEWSRAGGGAASTNLDWYLQQSGYEPFEHFWNTNRTLVTSFIRETERFRSLRRSGESAEQALTELRGNEAFMDSLKAQKTRLEGGLVSLDPHSGYVKAWVGGRSLATDWYDHVVTAARQPGSTFKPFVYTAAIDNGWSPYYRLPDSSYTYHVPGTEQVWTPGNFGDESSGAMMTLRDALAQSKNTVTARVITQLVNPSQVAFYARRMGIESPLDEVPALALGTSDVTLLEMTSAYGTLASGGLHYDPVMVMRIEDRFGNVLYEHQPSPEEALSEETAYTVVDMMRGIVNSSAGTGSRIRWQYGIPDSYDLAAKTGTTQNAADGWFIMMHPELINGAWVGFNDSRVTFRSTFWGQGAHNALFLVGDYFRKLTQAEDEFVSAEKRFPRPEEFDLDYDLPLPDDRRREDDDDRRVGW